MTVMSWLSVNCIGALHILIKFAPVLSVIDQGFSIQLLHKIFGLQMGITPEHLKRLMSGDRTNLHHVQPLLDESTGRLMT